ncbi:MAG: tetratricopeptide repeat protein [Syntrophales bacterium]|nr:tetratricopeptide repeat protein [Syntrophales bacterium]
MNRNHSSLPEPELPETEIAATILPLQRLIYLGLVLAILVVFGRLAFFDFVFFDDHVYVIEKAQVLAGITSASLRWALTATDAGFWHPLTWISLMVDHEIWGLNPGGYHLTNVLLHLAAALLLFAGLHRLTGALWKSGIVAALFALHPLHVESVAWIAERKDVLSGVLWMLSLLLYARYIERPGWGRYGLVLLAFVLGLMAKPMTVTFPFIMILLDVWPCNRLSGGKWRRNWKFIMAEKIPFFLFSILTGMVTILAENQVGALKTFSEFSFFTRLTNAVVAYGFYLYKTVWPFGLSVYYPHPGSWPFMVVILSFLVLGVITLFSLRRSKTEPYFLVGWLWYLISLLPVIGLVQIGSHAFADRYSYIPLIGVFIAVVWGLGHRVEMKKAWRRPVAVIGLMIIAFISITSLNQVKYWQNAETLFRRAVTVTEKNYLALNNLGAALSRQGRHQEAVVCFEEALTIKPDYFDAFFNMGVALAGQGHYGEAIAAYRKLLARNPGFAEAHNNIAIAYIHMGNLHQALIHFREAIRIRPDYEAAIKNLRVAEGR